MADEIPRLTMKHAQGYDCLNHDGMKFSEAVAGALEPVFVEWVNKGYNLYDLMGAAHGQVEMMAITMLVREVEAEEKTNG